MKMNLFCNPVCQWISFSVPSFFLHEGTSLSNKFSNFTNTVDFFHWSSFCQCRCINLLLKLLALIQGGFTISQQQSCHYCKLLTSGGVIIEQLGKCMLWRWGLAHSINHVNCMTSVLQLIFGCWAHSAIGCWCICGWFTKIVWGCAWYFPGAIQHWRPPSNWRGHTFMPIFRLWVYVSNWESFRVAVFWCAFWFSP